MDLHHQSHITHPHPPFLLARRAEPHLAGLTSLRLVSEVRIHTFHLTHYRTAERGYVHISTSPWVVVKFVLSCINPGPRVESNRETERVIKVTFDNFLYPVIEAWKAKKPYIPLISRLPASESTRITTIYELPQLFLGLWRVVRGYSTESDHEVDVERVSESEDE